MQEQIQVILFLHSKNSAPSVCVCVCVLMRPGYFSYRLFLSRKHLSLTNSHHSFCNKIKCVFLSVCVCVCKGVYARARLQLR